MTNKRGIPQRTIGNIPKIQSDTIIEITSTHRDLIIKESTPQNKKPSTSTLKETALPNDPILNSIDVQIQEPQSSKQLNRAQQSSSKVERPEYYTKGGTKSRRRCTLISKLVWLIIMIFSYANSYLRAHIAIGHVKYVNTYLTNLSMLIVCIYLLTGVIHCWKDRNLNDSKIFTEQSSKNSKFSQFYRIMHIMAANAEFVVVIYYWIGKAPYSLPKYPSVCDSLTYCYASTISVHGLGLIPTWLPFFTELTFVQWKDFMWPLAFEIFYCVFILAPVSLWVKQLYPGITFKDGITFVILIAVWLLALIGFALLKWASNSRERKFKLNKQMHNTTIKNKILEL